MLLYLDEEHFLFILMRAFEYFALSVIGVRSLGKLGMTVGRSHTSDR